MKTYFVLVQSSCTKLTDELSFLVQAESAEGAWRHAERTVHARTAHTTLKYVIVKFERVE